MFRKCFLPLVVIFAATIFFVDTAFNCSLANAATPNNVSSGSMLSPATTDKVLASFRDPLTMFGLVAVTLMLVFYALEARSPHYVFGFAIACVMGSTYGFLQGAWPFGMVEAIWSVVALRKWWSKVADAKLH